MIINIEMKGNIDLESDIFQNRTTILLKNELIKRSFSSRTRNGVKSASSEMIPEPKKKDVLVANPNVIDIILKAFVDAPSLQRLQNCDTCHVEKFPLKPDILLKVDKIKLYMCGFTELTKLVEEEINFQLRCRTCMAKKRNNAKKAHSTVELYHHILLDVVHDQYKGFKLSSMPVEIIILKKKFLICGLVSFMDQKFTSFCFVDGYWIKFDDMKDSPEKLVDIQNIDVKPHFLLFVDATLFHE